ncbi:MAG: carbohydrate binding domain-containing protein [Kiritimatiellae bacterium]|nr:carbohydrate binding domain-containing protein [Kiritimatiellia bacterium]
MNRIKMSACDIVLAGLMVGGGFLQAALGAESVNLIKNPGFTDGMANWKAESKLFPEGVTHELDSAAKKGDTGSSLKISTKLQIITRMIQSPDFAVAPGEKYTLSAWVKTSGSAQAAVVVKLGGKYTGTNYKESVGPDFRKVEMFFVIPDGVTSLSYIALYLKGSDGSVWFDDVSLAKQP